MITPRNFGIKDHMDMIYLNMNGLVLLFFFFLYSNDLYRHRGSIVVVVVVVVKIPSQCLILVLIGSIKFVSF